MATAEIRSSDHPQGWGGRGALELSPAAGGIQTDMATLGDRLAASLTIGLRYGAPWHLLSFAPWHLVLSIFDVRTQTRTQTRTQMLTAAVLGTAGTEKTKMLGSEWIKRLSTSGRRASLGGKRKQVTELWKDEGGSGRTWLSERAGQAGRKRPCAPLPAPRLLQRAKPRAQSEGQRSPRARGGEGTTRQSAEGSQGSEAPRATPQ